MPNQHTTKSYDPIARFWSHVNKNGSIPAHRPELGQCWEWTATCNSKSGYGQITFKKIKTSSHRVSWTINCGIIPDGLFVLHKCDNRKCVNPSHLFLGTNQDNMKDRNAKGRQARIAYHGATNPHHKLTLEQVQFIREHYVRNKVTYKYFAEIFNVTIQCIWAVVSGDTWK